jgi:hypothetical protein
LKTADSEVGRYKKEEVDRVKMEEVGRYKKEEVDRVKMEEVGRYKEGEVVRVERNGAACLCGDDGSTVDVLFVYTPAALAEVGGDVGALSSRADTVISFTNLVLGNSLVDLEMRRVGLMPVSYVGDVASGDCVLHLSRLSDVGDGFIEEVHGLRDAAAADLVMMLVGGETVGGCAWGAQDAIYGFSVIDILSDVTYTGAHELGHNLGLAHSRFEKSPDDPFSFNFGYPFTGAGGTTLGTVMVGGGYPGPLTYVPYYSNPDVLLDGVPVGGAMETAQAANAALAIQLNRHRVANYRVSGDIFDCDDNGVADGVQIGGDPSLDLNDNGWIDSCEARMYVDQGAVAAGSGWSWDGARRELRSAMRDASVPCSNVKELWVAEGVYLPDQMSGERGRRFEAGGNCGLTVYGGFAGGEVSVLERDVDVHPVVLSGEIGGAGPEDNTHHVLAVGPTQGIEFDGLTIADGYADGAFGFSGGGGLFVDEGANVTLTDVDFVNHFGLFNGGAVLISDGAIATFESCLFEGNRSDLFGGAIECFDSILSLSDCVIRENTGLAGGGVSIRFNTAGAVIAGCTIVDNEGTDGGGGVWLDSFGSVSVIGGSISGNDSSGSGAGAVAWRGGTLGLHGVTMDGNVGGGFGGAIDIWNGTQVLMTDCVVTNNVGDLGGGLALTTGPDGESSAQLVQCLIARNEARFGGAIRPAGAGTVVTSTNCTFGGNEASDFGGTLLIENSAEVFLTNTIVSDLGGASVASAVELFGGVLTGTYSFVQGGLVGAGNINSGSPSFVDAAGGNYRLMTGSLGVDSGRNVDVPDGLDFDLNGGLRLLDDPNTIDCAQAPGTCGVSPIVDMGAYEVLACLADGSGDLDSDGDVDLVDFGAFQLCFTGSGGVLSGSNCVCSDFDGDGDVDLVDFGGFQLAFTGSS